MTETTRAAKLSRVVCRVLEQTAFLFPEALEPEAKVSFENQEPICIQLSYTGDQQGEVHLVLPRALCRELATNVLGEDLSDTEEAEKSIDAAREMLNIITGQLLIELYGDSALFTLQAPRLIELKAEEIDTFLKGKDFAGSMVDAYPVLATLTTETCAYEHKGTGR